MEEVLMFTDTRLFNERIAQHSIHLGALNAILAAYEVMKLPKLSGKEFISLVQHPATIVFDKMINGEPVKIMGMQVNKSKAMELILKPAGYTEMIDAIEVYRLTPQWHLHLNKVDVVNDEVVLAQSTIDAETKASKVYARTEKEKQLFQFLQGVIKAANEAFGEGENHNLPEILEHTIFTRATPTGTAAMPLNRYSYDIHYRQIIGFGSPDFRYRQH